MEQHSQSKKRALLTSDGNPFREQLVELIRLASEQRQSLAAEENPSTLVRCAKISFHHIAKTLARIASQLNDETTATHASNLPQQESMRKRPKTNSPYSPEHIPYVVSLDSGNRQFESFDSGDGTNEKSEQNHQSESPNNAMNFLVSVALDHRRMEESDHVDKSHADATTKPLANCAPAPESTRYTSDHAIAQLSETINRLNKAEARDIRRLSSREQASTLPHEYPLQRWNEARDQTSTLPHDYQSRRLPNEPHFQRWSEARDLTPRLPNEPHFQRWTETTEQNSTLPTERHFHRWSETHQQNSTWPNKRRWQRWSDEEDNFLRIAISRFNQDWDRISKVYFQGHRSSKQCSTRWKRIRQPDLKKGGWQPEEDMLILELQKRGTKWVEIAEQLTGRRGEQVCERFANVLDPTLKCTPWTQEEDDILASNQREIGNKWSQIANKLPGRSELSIKNRWHNAQKKTTTKQRQQQRAEKKKTSMKKCTNVNITLPRIVEDSLESDRWRNAKSDVQCQQQRWENNEAPTENDKNARITPPPIVVHSTQSVDGVISRTARQTQRGGFLNHHGPVLSHGSFLENGDFLNHGAFLKHPRMG